MIKCEVIIVVQNSITFLIFVYFDCVILFKALKIILICILKNFHFVFYCLNYYVIFESEVIDIEIWIREPQPKSFCVPTRLYTAFIKHALLINS